MRSDRERSAEQDIKKIQVSLDALKQALLDTTAAEATTPQPPATTE